MIERIKELQDTIKNAEAEIAFIRNQCEHKHTFEGTYSWRIGNYQPVIICSDCCGLVSMIGRPFEIPKVTTIDGLEISGKVWDATMPKMGSANKPLIITNSMPLTDGSHELPS